MRKRDRTNLTASVALLQTVDELLARAVGGKFTRRERRFMCFVRAILRRVLCDLSRIVGRDDMAEGYDPASIAPVR